MDSIKTKSQDWTKFVQDEKFAIEKQLARLIDEYQVTSHAPDDSEWYERRFFHRYLPVSAFSEETFPWALECCCKYAADVIKKKAGNKNIYIDSLTGWIERVPDKAMFLGEPLVQFVLKVEYELWGDYAS